MPLPVIGTISSLQGSSNEEEDILHQEQTDDATAKVAAPAKPAAAPSHYHRSQASPDALRLRQDERNIMLQDPDLSHTSIQDKTLSAHSIPVHDNHSHVSDPERPRLPSHSHHYQNHDFPSIGQIQSATTQQQRPPHLSSAGHSSSSSSSVVQVPQISTYSQSNIPHIHSPPAISSGHNSPRIPNNSVNTQGTPQILQSPNDACTSASNNSLTRKRRPYNASCDGCRTRKRKCIRGPDKDSWQCLNCSERGIACTFGNLGEPTRLRRADLEIQRLKGILDGISQSGNPEETEKLLREYAEQHAGEPRKPGRPRRQSHLQLAKRTRQSTDIEILDSPHHSINMPPLGGLPNIAHFSDEHVGFSSPHAMRHLVGGGPVASTSTSVTGNGQVATGSTGSSYPHLSHLTNSTDENGISEDNHRAPMPLPSASHPDYGSKTAAVNAPRLAIGKMEDADIDLNNASADFRDADMSHEPTKREADDLLLNDMMSFVNKSVPRDDDLLPAEDEHEYLLDYYFAWINPRYSLLDRALLQESRLRRDERYCTPFLLWSLYAHIAHHAPSFMGRQAAYRTRAHLLLSIEMAKADMCTLPTGQAILLLAGTAGAASNYSLAWTLTNSAMAIAKDLIDKLEGLPRDPVERAMRVRLYWGCYVFSIVMALNLNKKPPVDRLYIELPEIPHGDGGSWMPVFPVPGNPDPAAMDALSRPRPGYVLASVRETCYVFTCLDDILRNIHAVKKEKRSLGEAFHIVRDIRQRMLHWQARTNPHIWLDCENLPEESPPPHIVHFNLLVRATWIVLFRPFYAINPPNNALPDVRSVSELAAREIHLLFVLYERTFGLLRLTYIYIYAAYWAAVTDVALAKRERMSPDLLNRLRYSSKVLLYWAAMPGMRHSVSHLIDEIERLLLATQARATDSPHRLPGMRDSSDGVLLPVPPMISNTSSSSAPWTPVTSETRLPDGSFPPPQINHPPRQAVHHHGSSHHPMYANGFPAPSVMAMSGMQNSQFPTSAELYWTLPSWQTWQA